MKARQTGAGKCRNSASDSAAPALYPIYLNLQHVSVLVVGGGEVALRKIQLLLEVGARVTVVAPAFHEDLGQLARGCRSLRLLGHRFSPKALKDKRLVFAATDDQALNRQIAAACRKRGIWANVAAPPAAGDFYVPATVRRGPFCVAVSTGGGSAHLARQWRERLEKLIGPEWGVLAELLAEKRQKVLAGVADAELRQRILVALGDFRFAARLKRKGAAAVSAQMDRLIARGLRRSKMGAAVSKSKKRGGVRL